MGRREGEVSLTKTKENVLLHGTVNVNSYRVISCDRHLPLSLDP